MKKANIKITLPQTDKATAKRPVVVLVFLLFGVLGLMLYLDSIGGVTFSKLLYPFSILLCIALWYIYFHLRKLLTPFLILTAAVLAVTGFLGYRTIYVQAMDLGNALLGDSTKVRITLLCTIIALIIVFTLFFFEIALNNQIILYLVTSFFIISAPVLGYSVSAVSYVLLFMFQIAFFAVSATGAGSKKTLTSPDCTYRICSKAVITSVTAVAVILVMVFYLVKGFANTLYESVYTAEGFVKDTVNSLASYTLSPYENGSISKGNLYTSGNTTLIVSAQNIPSDTVYLKSYIGDEYKSSSWSKAGDDPITQEILDNIDWEDSYGDKEPIMINYINQIPLLYSDYNYSNYITINKQFDEDLNEYVPYFSIISYSNDSNNMSCYNLFSISDIDPEYYQTHIPPSYSITITDETDELYATIDLDSNWYNEFYEKYKNYANERFIKYDRNNTPKLSEYCEEHPLSKLDEITTFIAYTLQSNTKYNKTPGMSKMSSDVVEDFLFNRRQGYCVHYASTAALMYRMYGIPARYVSGYSVSPDQFVDMGSAVSSRIDEDGNPVSIDMYTPFSAELTDEDAHAWVEIFLDGYGWVPVEFTPDSNGNIMPYYPSFTDTTFNDILNEKGWNINVPSIPVETSSRGASATSSFITLRQSSRAAIILIAAGIIAATFGLILIRRAVILRRFRKSPPKKLFTRLINMLNFTKFYNYSGDEENLADRLSLRFSPPIKPNDSVNTSLKNKSQSWQRPVSEEDLKLMLDIYSEAAFGPDKISEDKKRYLLVMYRRLSLISYLSERSRIKRLVFKYVKAYI